MYPVYSTNTQLHYIVNQILIQSDIAGNTINRISEISRAQAKNQIQDIWIDSLARYRYINYTVMRTLN